MTTSDVDQTAKTALQRLLDEPKGKTEYTPSETFLLHVFWEAPSMAAAKELLSGLKQCATATHRDTPCVPTYFFRISSNNADLYGSAPKFVKDHPQIMDAKKKLRVGTPKPAVLADLARRGLDPALVDLEPDVELPVELQQQPVGVECTELYLDERGFMEHAGSKDYLQAYGIVMKPSLQTRHVTVRLGTPPPNIIETILAPMLKERVEPVGDGCAVWRKPASAGRAVFVSLDVPTAHMSQLDATLHSHCTTCVAFAHPLREDTMRLMCVFPVLPSDEVLSMLTRLKPQRGEAHCEEVAGEDVRRAFQTVGLDAITVNGSESVGYVLHQRVTELAEL